MNIIADNGIVISSIHHLGNRYLVNVYTENNGRQTFLFFRNKTRKSPFQPFHYLEVSYEPSERKNIFRLTTYQVLNASEEAFFQIAKSMQLLFLAEILNQTLIHEANKHLFAFLKTSLSYLSSNSDNKFYIDFLIFYSRFIGIDIRKHTLSDYPHNFKTYIHTLCEYTPCQALSRQEKTQFLNNIIQFYEEQLGLRLQLKSLPVLQSYFH